MTKATPGLVQVCLHCDQPIAWSLPMCTWLHAATGLAECGGVAVDGL